MEKIISKSQRKKIERNNAIIKEFNTLMENGSAKTATYEYLAKKYGLKAPAIYTIIKKNNTGK